MSLGARGTALLLHGFLGTGKTSLAKRLEEDRSAIRFSHDEWMSRLFGDDPPAAQFAVNAARVHQVMEQVWTRILRLGGTVVLDFGFWSRAERDRTRSLLSGLGADFVLYRLTCPDEVAWQRIERRNAQLDGSLHIAPATYALLKHRFEPLDADEAFIDKTD